MARKPFPRKLVRNHVELLAGRYGIEINWIRNPDAAWADDLERSIGIAKPTDPQRYLVALHELGHLLDPEARRLGKQLARADARGAVLDLGKLMACEGYAWGWAMAHVIPEVRPMFGARHWRQTAEDFMSVLYYAHMPNIDE